MTEDWPDDVTALLERWPMGGTFDLPPASTVVVVGSYKGLTIDLLDRLYHPAAIVGFEPQLWAFQYAFDRVGDRRNVILFPYGLGVTSGRFDMGEWGTDACSLVNVGPASREHGYGVLVEAANALAGNDPIDLMLVNIEGYEFELLPHLYDRGEMGRVRRLVVQFHHGFGNDEGFAALRERIEQDFECVADETPAWVYWCKRQVTG